MSIKTLDELLAEGVEGRGVLVRSDLNVPLDENGNITDPGRIIASVPTLAALADAGHEVTVLTCFTRSVPDPTGFALACQLDKGLPAEADYMALRRADQLPPPRAYLGGYQGEPRRDELRARPAPLVQPAPLPAGAAVAGGAGVAWVELCIDYEVASGCDIKTAKRKRGFFLPETKKTRFKKTRLPRKSKRNSLFLFPAAENT